MVDLYRMGRLQYSQGNYQAAVACLERYVGTSFAQSPKWIWEDERMVTGLLIAQECILEGA